MEYKPQPDRYTNGMFYRRCGDSGDKTLRWYSGPVEVYIP